MREKSRHQLRVFTGHLYVLVFNGMCEVSECIYHLCAVVAAVLDNPLHLLVNQLHAAQTRLLQTLDLPLHQQLK